MASNQNDQTRFPEKKKGLEIDIKQPTAIEDPFLTIHRRTKDQNDQSIIKSYQVMVCHRLPERSIHFRGKPLICYRCAGTYLSFSALLLYQIVGILIGFQLLLGPVRSWFLALAGNNILIQFLWMIGLMLPMIIDGTYQAMDNDYTSTNFRRLITGLLAGLGYFAMLLVLGSIYLAILNLF